MVPRGEVFLGSDVNLPRGDQSLDGINRPGHGAGMKKLPEPSNKPFILGLAEEILGPRARFFIWLPVTTHPALASSSKR